jgi:uncharacterized protein
VRILIDILHPTHVHVFRNVIAELVARGHEIKLTTREKDVARDLLDQYGFSYEIISRQRSGSGLALEFAERGVRLWRAAERFRPHILAGCMGPSIASVGRLRRAVARDRARIVVFYDTERAPLTNSFVYPLADFVCTADCYSAAVRGNHVTYPSYQQLAYLHPKRFTPDPEIVRRAGIDPDSRYFLVRFVSYQASHDFDADSIPLAKKLALVEALAPHGRVLVSSEKGVPPELAAYALKIPASHLHHVLAHATLLVGESATMASEAACLGVTAVYISPHGRGYTDDQERRYGLVHNFIRERFHGDWVSAVRELAADTTLAARARAARARLLNDKLDLTAWMLEFFERTYAGEFGAGG